MADLPARSDRDAWLVETETDALHDTDDSTGSALSGAAAEALADAARQGRLADRELAVALERPEPAGAPTSARYLDELGRRRLFRSAPARGTPSATQTVAGVAIPDTALAREATEFVQDAATELLFDHSRRVFLWAALQGLKLGVEYDPEMLYVGSMFHDIGLVEGHRSKDERFEIDGANAARAFSSATV